MGKLKKAWVIILAVQLMLLAAGNIIISATTEKEGRIFRVEGRRIAAELEKKTLSEIDLSEYTSVVRVEPFNPDDICAEDYIVEEAGGILYRIAYREQKDFFPVICFNILAGIVILTSAALFLYINSKIIKPFSSMSELTASMAKGNLSTPLKQEKSRYFGKFIWGLDMLRENLESKKESELALHKEKKTLILSLSHDIKTPLSAIELYTRALESGLYSSAEEKKNAFEGIRKNTGDIKDYVNKIMQASREDFLNLTVNNSEVYLQKVMDGIEAYYRDRLSVIHTEFSVEQCRNCIVHADEDRLTEVLQNIMENAVKYGDGGKISISFDDEEDCRLICVSNTGNTLKEEEIPHIFESFYRGSNSESVKGSGLGLYICKQLMKLMDGDVFAKCDGNIFKVTVVVKKA